MERKARTPARDESQVSDPVPKRRSARYPKRSSVSRKRKEGSASMVECKNSEVATMNENALELEDYDIPLIRLRKKRRIERASNSVDSELELIEVPLRVVTDDAELSGICNGKGAQLGQPSSMVTYSRPQSVVLPGDFPCLTYKDNTSEKYESHPEVDNSEPTGSKSLVNKDGDFTCNHSLKLMDQKRGELCMLCDDTAHSGFRAPDLDKVVIAVEEECRKVYGIMQPDFSLMKLMSEVRVRFVEMGTFTSTGEQNAPSQTGGSFTVTTTVEQPCIDDITKGEEKMKVSVVKGSAPEDLQSFTYIARNLVYDKANVKFTLAGKFEGSCRQRCAEDCLNSSIPCSCAEIGGGFCYTLSGLVKDKFLDECISLEKGTLKNCCFGSFRCPVVRSETNVSYSCRGHVKRKFIKECWSTCGCSKRCGNRVVQRGITRKLQVFWDDEGKRWGLRTLERLPRGAFVCEYVGEIVTSFELYVRRMQNPKNRHSVPLDAAWSLNHVLNDEEALFLDATDHGNIARFINYRCCDANLVQIPVKVESTSHHYYHVALFTRREVAVMEELTWDYGFEVM